MKPKGLRTAKLAGVLVAVVVTAVIALQTLEPRGTMARFHKQQLVGYHHTTPPPWPNGNGFSVLPRWMWLRERYLPWLSEHVGRPKDWRVLNMYAENLEALSRQLGFQWVKVEKMGEQAGTVLCLVVHTRVPREWLLERPRTDGTRVDYHEDQGSFPQVRYRLAKPNEGQPNVAP